jgi:hypothetical protein
VDNVTDQPVSPAVKRFREFVRQRRALLPRKERGDREVYWIASLRQILEQVGFEMNAGITHDPSEVKGLIDLANVEAAAKKPAKARFRGLGR